MHHSACKWLWLYCLVRYLLATVNKTVMKYSLIEIDSFTYNINKSK